MEKLPNLAGENHSVEPTVIKSKMEHKVREAGSAKS